MKRLSLVLILAALALPQAGQAGWWRTYGGEGYDVGNCVQITLDGNYITTGAPWVLLKVDTSGNVIWSRNYYGIIGKWVEQTTDSGYIVATWNPTLLRANAQGDSVWTKSYGIYSYCVQPTYEGGYLVTGGTNGYGYDEKLILVKTNSQGDTIWTKNYAELGNNRNTGYFIQRTNDGGYVVTGLTGYADDYVDYTNLWILKLDENGNKEWSKIYGSDDRSVGHSIQQLENGNYIITGFKGSGNSLWLIKTNTEGDTLWTRTYKTSTGGRGFSVQGTSDGGYIVTGATVPMSFFLAPQYGDLWLLKTNNTGDTIWSRFYGGNGSDVGECVQQTNDGGYIVTGATSSYGSGNLYLVKTDSLGLLAVEEKSNLDQTKKWEVVSSFGKQITLRYSNNTGNFSAAIFDVSGRKVDELRPTDNSGILVWGRGNPSGVYFIQVKDNYNKIDNLKVVLIR